MAYKEKTKSELKKDFLKYLISIRRIKNINTNVHRYATELARDYIKRKVKRNRETIVNMDLNPGPSPGKDIFIKTNKETHYAEVLCNDSYKEGEQFKKLCKDIDKLKRARATKKYLFLLSKTQQEKVAKKLSKQKISLDGIKILTIFQRKNGFI